MPVLSVLIHSMKERLFDISAKKLTFRCKEDEIFFDDQKKQRKFTIGCIDSKDNLRIKRTLERKERDKRKFEHSKNTFVTEFPEMNDIVLPTTSDPLWTPPELSKRQIQ